MSDTRYLAFPMTARDVVVSTRIVGFEERGDGPQPRLYDVLDVQHVGAAVEGGEPEIGLVRIVCKAPHGGDPVVFDLLPDTPLLLTGIRRR